jgi:tetratricopeptide (TPR) repeat protein
MDVNPASSPLPDAPYPALFREYIRRGTQVTLEAVRSAGPALPAEQREQSLLTLEFAMDLPDAWPEARDLLITLTPKLDLAGMRQDAVLVLQRGIEQCQAQGDTAGQAELEVQLGVLKMATGRMEEARALFGASAGRFATVGDLHNQARALNSWAYLDHLQQRSESAARLVQQAMSLVGPDDTEITYGQFVLGSMAVDNRDWPAALAYYQQALAGWRRHDDPVMVARSLTNLGTAQRGAGQFDEAVASYNEAIELMGQLDDPVNQAMTRLNLGNLYWAMGQPQQAIVHLREAEPVFRQAHDDLRLARANTNMGVVYLQLGQLEQAQAALTTGVELSRMVGDRRLAANALDTLGELYLRLEQPAAALTYLDQALADLGDLVDRPGYASLVAEIQEHRQAALAGLAAWPGRRHGP